jgi:outer membrane protein
MIRHSSKLRLVCLIALVIYGNDAHAMGLVDSWQAALNHDPDYRSALASRDASEESAQQASSLFRPKVQLLAGAVRAGSSTQVQVPDQFQALSTKRTNNSQASAELQVSMPLYDAEATARAVQLNKQTEAGRASFRAEDQRLMVRVGDATFGLMAAKTNVALALSQIALFQQEKEQAQRRFELGNARIADVREAEAQLDIARAAEIDAVAQRDLAIAQFSELTAIDGSEVGRLKNEFIPRLPSLPLGDWQDKAEHESPKVITSGLNVDVARASIDQFKWTGRPKISAVGSYSGLWRTGSASSLLSPESVRGYTVGVQLAVPLETGGLYASELREAVAKLQKAQSDLDAARRDVRIQIQQAWLGVSSGASRIKALRAALVSAELRQGAAILGREVGQRTQSDVLAAQSQVYSTKKSLNEASCDYQKSRIQLAAAAGQLDVELLSQIDQDLELKSP